MTSKDDYTDTTSKKCVPCKQTNSKDAPNSV